MLAPSAQSLRTNLGARTHPNVSCCSSGAKQTRKPQQPVNRHTAERAPHTVSVKVDADKQQGEIAADADAPKPSYIRRCRTVNALIGMLHKHHQSVSPQFWVTALCHLSELVADAEQQIPLHNWSQLQRSLLYLADPQAVVAAKQQRRWRQIQQWIQQQKDAGTWQDQQPQQQQQEASLDSGHESLTQQQQRAAPIQKFAASDIATLLWALARIQSHLSKQQQQQLGRELQQQRLILPDSMWAPILQQTIATSSQLTPRDTALLAWSLLRLQAPVPAGWFQQIIDLQAQALPTYPSRALTLVLYSCARGAARIPASSSSAILAKLQLELPGLSCRDLSMTVWSLGPLEIRPPPVFMAAAMAASKRQLSSADWPEVVALLSGTARLGWLPPGHWLLELYDQLYWTVDQLELRQLVAVVWALGRLKVVAVPQELLERLVAFARLQLQPLLQKQQQQQGISNTSSVVAAGGDCGNSSNSSSFQEQQQQFSSNSSAAAAAAATSEVSVRCSSSFRSSSNSSSNAESKQQYILAKHLYMLLQGLAGLKAKLSPKLRHEIGSSWMPAVLASQGPTTHVYVPACLHACAALEVQLPPAVQAAALSSLAQLQQYMSHGGMALGLWGAVRVGCQTSRVWLEQWLGSSEKLLGIASSGEVIMMLRALAKLKQRPTDDWLEAAYARLQVLVSSSSNSSSKNSGFLEGLRQQQSSPACQQLNASEMAAVVKCLVDFGVQSVPEGLLRGMSERTAQLEIHRESPGAVQRFHLYASQLQHGLLLSAFEMGRGADGSIAMADG